MKKDMVRVPRVVQALTLAAFAVLSGACNGDPTSVQDGSFEYRVQDLVVAESFPVQFGVTVEIENVGSETASVTFRSGCVVFFRVYDGDDAVWDLGNQIACPAVLYGLELDPGEVRQFSTATVSAADVLGDKLPDGEYRVTAYLLPGDETVEMTAGNVDLAIPR